MTAALAAHARLEAELGRLGHVAVAVSGGVDSMTLAAVAHRTTAGATMFHAVSAAVPATATDRVRAHAAREGWDVRYVDAGEFDDPSYLANPVDRCYSCKRSLYGAVLAHTSAPVVSGTNTDDLGDYRPGLRAAAEADVRHPYVDAGIDKAGVRAIAARLGLHDLADLPASPCLSSRVETGIPITPAWLAVIEDVERELTAQIRPATVRCRLRADRVGLEVDPLTLDRLDTAERDRLAALVAGRWADVGVDLPVRFEEYRMGSAFVQIR